MGKNHVVTFLLAAAIIPSPALHCYSLKDLKDVACNVVCLKNRQHYEHGVYDESLNACWCMDRVDYDQAMEKTMTLPIRNNVSHSDTGQ